jgi:hypothetical protein
MSELIFDYQANWRHFFRQVANTVGVADVPDARRH